MFRDRQEAGLLLAGLLKKFKNDDGVVGSGDRQKNERYSDIVNEIVTTVIKKNGQVTIMEKDSLLAYKRIALITRY